jgi:phosphoribosylformylglycinamidine synthase
VIKPLLGVDRDIPSDAAVVRPVLEAHAGIAVSQALNPFYSKIDTYHMTAATMDEAVRKTLAVGGDPAHLAGVDNFCWPTIEYHPEKNPDGKYKAAQLVRSNWALRDYCLAFGIPLLSGKDSMYVDGNLEGPYGERRKVSGLPTLLFTALSVIPDVRTCVTLDAKFPGDRVYVLGETRDELGGSEYYQMMGAVGLHIPKVAVEEVWPLYLALHQAIQEGRVASCHALYRGGLAVHLALTAMAGGLGLEADLSRIPAAPGLSPAQLLYSESCGRFLVTVSPENEERFQEIFSGMKVSGIGRMTESSAFVIRDAQGRPVVKEDVRELKEIWKRPFGDLI